MRLSGGRGLAVAGGDVPLHHVGVLLDLQGVQVVEVAGDVVLRVLAVVRQAAKQVDFVADDGEAVTQPRAWWGAIPGRLRFQLLPLPPGGLELEQVVAVFPVLHHPAEHQDPGPVHHKPEGSTAGRYVALDGRNKPLVGR